MREIPCEAKARRRLETTKPLEACPLRILTLTSWSCVFSVTWRGTRSVPRPIVFGTREGKLAVRERVWAFDMDTEFWGLHCECHSYQFCNEACLAKHMRGILPPEPPAAVAKYMSDKNRAAAEGLCLLQAYLLRDRREEEEEVSRGSGLVLLPAGFERT